MIIYDSTLRDGGQGEGISFSVRDKLKIVEILDEFKVDYIEAGNPGSNPKDLEFFREVKSLNLKNSKIAAFGSTRRANIKAKDDQNLKNILLADTKTATIFGKAWDFHVANIIRTTHDENLKMIEDTIKFLILNGKEVFFDAEHFFDGYKSNPRYAVEVVETALNSGAACAVLCDTNGGSMPLEVYDITKDMTLRFKDKIGVHCHNDSGCAVANTCVSVSAGAIHVQGTINGIGERAGNANLCTVIPNLKLKQGIDCISHDRLKTLYKLSRQVSELANVSHNESYPYVGASAFAHKGGMHIDAVNKNPQSFEHTPPESVGNERRILMSEVSGRSTILSIIQSYDEKLTKDSPETVRILEKIKDLEHKGYQFEGGEASVELLIIKELGFYKPFFDLEQFKIVISEPALNFSSSAITKVIVEGRDEITAAEGVGPVDAMDKALRKALEKFFPELKNIILTDYKVRVIDSNSATAAKVRVFIESTDGQNIWSTVGVSSDIIEASKIALISSIEYRLFMISHR